MNIETFINRMNDHFVAYSIADGNEPPGYGYLHLSNEHPHDGTKDSVTAYFKQHFDTLCEHGNYIVAVGGNLYTGVWHSDMPDRGQWYMLTSAPTFSNN